MYNYKIVLQGLYYSLNLYFFVKKQNNKD